MASIFISYRREDTRADAGRLYDHLSAHFGADHVFMDIDDIAPGADFVEVLDRTLAGVDVLLVLIGPGWLTPDEHGRRRIHDDGDFVRVEIERGLARGARIVPVLVGAAAMPGRADLPAGLGPLSQRQAIEISDSRFRDDVERLIEAIEIRAGSARRWRRPALAGGAAALVAGALLAWFVLHEPRVLLRAEPAVIDRGAFEAMVARHDFYDARTNAAGRGVGNRFEPRVAGDAVVIDDKRTGLSWEKAGSGYWNAAVIDKSHARIAALNDARYAGYTDWRLPTLEEAMSLVTPEPVREFHIAGVFDASEAPQMLTADTTSSGAVWVVYLHEGMALPEATRYNAWTRAVRGPD